MKCNECPQKEKCLRQYELALAGVTEWKCAYPVEEKKDNEKHNN